MALTKAKLIADGVIVVGNLHSSHGITSANIGENTNLYFTNARARSAISVSGNALSYNSSTGVITSNFEEAPVFTGTVTIPEYIVHSGDTDTFFGFVTDNEYKVTVGNSTKIFADANAAYLYYQGNQKIRTTNTGVNVTGGGDFSGGVTITTTNSPGLKISKDKSVDNRFLRFNDTASGGKDYDIINNGNFSVYNHTDNNFILQITSAGNATLVGEVVIQDATHSTFKIKSGNNDNILFAQAIQSDNARIGTDTNTPLSFFTNQAERLRIDTSGNVGIGVTSPGARFHVDNSAADAIIRLSKGSSTIGNIDFVNEGNRFSIQDDGTRRLVIDTSGNVGIGTTSPQSKLHISTSSTNAPIRLQNDNGSGSTANFVLQTDSSGLGNNGFGIYDVANSAYRLVINGSGNVGIATTSPGSKLDVTHVGADAINVGAGNDFSGIRWTGDSHAFSWRIGGDNFFVYDVTNSAQRLTITDAGNVSIGVNSPNSYVNQTTLTINGSVVGRIDLESAGTLRSSLFSLAANTTLAVDSGFFTIDVGGAERLRIDTSGNVLIGKTTNTIGGAGVVIRNAGEIFSTRAGDVAGFNRLTSDGNIVQFYKDGSVIGAIGCNSSGGNPVLDIASSSSTSLMRFLTSGSERIRITSGGNVGIGTTSPGSILDIVDTSATTTLTLGRSGEVPEIKAGGTNTDLRLTAVGSGGFLDFQTNGNRRMIIKGGGNVGIGDIASPESYYADNLVVLGGDEKGITIANSSTTGKSYLCFADGTSGAAAYTGYVAYDHNDNSLSFANDGGSNRLTVATGGNITVFKRLFQKTDDGALSAGTPRYISISHGGGGGTFTYNFNPVDKFGCQPQGGQVELQVTGWMSAVNNGFIVWRDNGSNTNIGNGSVDYRQTVYYNGAQSGDNLISVAKNSGGNMITITFTGWHSNSHGFQARIINHH